MRLYRSQERRAIPGLLPHDSYAFTIRTNTGQDEPLSSVATIELGQGYTSIVRVDGKRSISVSANVNKDKIEPGEVVEDIQKTFIPQLLMKYPDVSSQLDGEAKEEGEAVFGLLKGAFFALFAIYALMAIPLRSYSQPLIIMSVIPFGVIGAIFGHFV